MPIFECTQCHCIDNTACCHYWSREHKEEALLCSECDPAIGKWHDRFPKESAEGYWLGNDGFLYHDDEVKSDQLDWRKEHQGFKLVARLGPIVGPAIE